MRDAGMWLAVALTCAVLLPACGHDGLAPPDEDGGTEDTQPDTALSDAPASLPDLPSPPDLPWSAPDLPATVDLPPSGPDGSVDVPPRRDTPPGDSTSDPVRFYERPDVFTHEARPLEAGVVDSPPGPIDLAPGDVLRRDLSAPRWDGGAPDANPRMVEYPLPASAAAPQDIVAGPDGNLWFTDASGRIGRITTTGVITSFPVPTADCFPASIVAGPDGNLWFTEAYGDRIGRITPTGLLTEFLVPTVDCGPGDITVGPDGNLWFTELMGNKIGRLTPAGEFAEYMVTPETVWPASITVGPDGNLWFTTNGIALGRISTAGALEPVFLPFDLGTPIIPTDILTGPDGNLWLGLWHSDTRVVSVLRLGLDGSTKEMVLPGEDNGSGGMTFGPDGNLWLTLDNDRVGRFTLDGQLTTFPTSRGDARPQGITVGPDGSIWFTETQGSIGRIIL